MVALFLLSILVQVTYIRAAMIFVQVAAVSVLAALSVAAAPSSARHVLHEKRHRSSVDWVKGTRIESSAVLPVRIGLTQTDLHKGPDYLSTYRSKKV